MKTAIFSFTLLLGSALVQLWSVDASVMPNQAFTYIMTNVKLRDGRIGQLKKSVHLLVHHYLQPFHLEGSTKIILAHDKSLTETLQEEIKLLWAAGAIEFALIDSGDPDFKPPTWRMKGKPSGRYLHCANRIWHKEYQEMMTYKIHNLWLLPAFDGLERVSLMDTDMYFINPPSFDMMEKFKTENGIYAYAECKREKAHDCLTGLPEAVGTYVRDQHIRPKHLHKVEWNTAYSLNFNIVKLSFFRSQEYQKFVEQAILQSHNWYRHSWRDQNCLALALAVLVEEEYVFNWAPLLSNTLRHESKGLGGQRWVGGNFTPYSHDIQCYNETGCSCEQTKEAQEARLKLYDLSFDDIPKP